MSRKYFVFYFPYFPTFPKYYTEFLNLCTQHKPQEAARLYLHAYAGGSQTYGPTIETLINQYNLTQYDY